MVATPEAPREWSPWERQLWSHLTGHIDAERGLLEEYSEVVGSTPSKALGYLVQLLLEDEIRHHKLFSELADALRVLADFGGDPKVPYLDFDRVDGTEVLAATRKLLSQEHDDARELDRLQRELRDVKDTTLWGLLVDLMQRDTQKHIAILDFVEKHTSGRRP